MRLTCLECGGRDLDLAGRLVGLEGGHVGAVWLEGGHVGAELGGEQVRALSARRAGAGAIAPMVGVLLVVHGNQLHRGGGGGGVSTDNSY